MGLEGIFGIPLDVAATYIILFTLYGAVLEYSGAARFFVQLSYAAFGGQPHGARAGRRRWPASCSAPCRAPAWRRPSRSAPSRGRCCARRAIRRTPAGGVLAAAGIGAILSPPTLGAAAFIIAEFLEESYFKVLLYALVPSLLYYIGILLAIEVDARRFRCHGAPSWRRPGSGGCWGARATTSSSLIAIVWLLAIGHVAVPRRALRDRAGVPDVVRGQARPDGAGEGLPRRW